MKTWITYLTSLLLGLATALLLGDAAWSLPLFGTLYTLAINTGTLLALAMVVVSTTSAFASLRKDGLGSRTAGISLAWTLVTALALPLMTGLVCAAFPVVFPVIYQRSGKLPRKAAIRNYNCIFPEPSPAAARRFPVLLHLGVLPAYPLTFL